MKEKFRNYQFVDGRLRDSASAMLRSCAPESDFDVDDVAEDVAVREKFWVLGQAVAPDFAHLQTRNSC